MTNFDKDRSGTGTREWSDISENIQRGCSNGCLYCYAAHDAVRRKQREKGNYTTEEFTKKASVKFYPKRDGLIMFPTVHDITTRNIDVCIRVLTLMLRAGNSVLIVTKPDPICVNLMLAAFKDFKDQILFRFSIGSLDDNDTKFWEPHAPSPANRVRSLRMAFNAGFKTSISSEPLLGGIVTARSIVSELSSYVTDSIWIGKMNKIDSRVDCHIPHSTERIAFIKQNQTNEEILKLYAEFKDNPLVMWKDSIKDVVTKG